ncbi:MAG: sugar phosphate isomerase/epimerase family protein, partial [Phycisphaerales bacterium JB040]
GPGGCRGGYSRPMLLSLNIRSIRELVSPKRGRAKVALTDVPRYTREELGLHGLTLTTDVLKGATREVLTGIRDSGDKSGCAVLALTEVEAQRFGDPSEARGDAAVERALRVVEAASLLGCNSCGVSVIAKDSEEGFDLSVGRLRRVVERAESLEINLLLSPCEGLTSEPERLTELIKKVGGFRIGTLPDFEQAARQKDPAMYLKRLTPYASVVNASTIEFTEAEAEPEGKGSKGKAKGAEPAVEEEDDDRPLTPEDLAAMLMEGDFEDLPDVPAPVHVGYALEPLVEAVTAVGYDGTLSIEYRGAGDGTLGAMQSREALEAAIEAIAERK